MKIQRRVRIHSGGEREGEIQGMKGEEERENTGKGGERGEEWRREKALSK